MDSYDLEPEQVLSASRWNPDYRTSSCKPSIKIASRILSKAKLVFIRNQNYLRNHCTRNINPPEEGKTGKHIRYKIHEKTLSTVLFSDIKTQLLSLTNSRNYTAVQISFQVITRGVSREWYVCSSWFYQKNDDDKPSDYLSQSYLLADDHQSRSNSQMTPQTDDEIDSGSSSAINPHPIYTVSV